MVSVDVDMCLQLSELSRPTCKVGPDSGRAYTLNDVPHPQLLFAFGLLKMNPLLTRLVS